MAQNYLDRIISYLNPRAGAQRENFRQLQDFLQKRRYEAAGMGKRTKGWRTSSTGPNAEIEGGLRALRNRSRDLVRNNPHAARAVKLIAGNTIGTGIVPQAAPGKDIDRAWRNWGETLQCDASGLLNFYGLQDLMMQSMVEGGECLIRRRIRVSDKSLDVPLQLEILEGDFIDDTKNEELAGGGFIWNGIEFDAKGRRAAYWLYQTHPGESRSFINSLESVRVPASEIIHLFRQDRLNQVRGVPWGAPCLIKLREFHEYDDAQLVRQKVSAAFAIFVRDTDQSVNQAPESPLDGDKVNPGGIHMLPPGKSIEFASPPTVGADYEPYAKISLRAVAAGFGVTYEALTQDYSNVNFSSGRMGWMEFNREIEKYRWLLLIPRVCDGIWDWFLEAAKLSGYRISKDDLRPKWTPPRREMIDPVKETNAAIRAVRAGIKTLSDVIRENGVDPLTHFEELKADNAIIDKLGLKLDSDARTTNLSGGFQVSNDKDENQNLDESGDDEDD